MEDGKPPTLTATAHEQIVELGTAADFGYCQASCKARLQCFLCSWRLRPIVLCFCRPSSKCSKILHRDDECGTAASSILRSSAGKLRFMLHNFTHCLHHASHTHPHLRAPCTERREVPQPCEHCRVPLLRVPCRLRVQEAAAVPRRLPGQHALHRFQPRAGSASDSECGLMGRIMLLSS